jgi:hypothetical protein
MCFCPAAQQRIPWQTLYSVGAGAGLGSWRLQRRGAAWAARRRLKQRFLYWPADHAHRSEGCRGRGSHQRRCAQGIAALSRRRGRGALRCGPGWEGRLPCLQSCCCSIRGKKSSDSRRLSCGIMCHRHKTVFQRPPGAAQSGRRRGASIPTLWLEGWRTAGSLGYKPGRHNPQILRWAGQRNGRHWQSVSEPSPRAAPSDPVSTLTRESLLPPGPAANLEVWRLACWCPSRRLGYPCRVFCVTYQ